MRGGAHHRLECEALSSLAALNARPAELGERRVAHRFQNEATVDPKVGGVCRPGTGNTEDVVVGGAQWRAQQRDGRPVGIPVDDRGEMRMRRRVDRERDRVAAACHL